MYMFFFREIENTTSITAIVLLLFLLLPSLGFWFPFPGRSRGCCCCTCSSSFCQLLEPMMLWNQFFIILFIIKITVIITGKFFRGCCIFITRIIIGIASAHWFFIFIIIVIIVIRKWRGGCRRWRWRFSCCWRRWPSGLKIFCKKNREREVFKKNSCIYLYFPDVV